MSGDAIDWLYGLQSYGIKLGLTGIRSLLELLGHPHRAYPAVLVGGTNGKGSVSAMLDAVLAASGRHAGLYTSPHLVRPHERIRIGGRDLDDTTLRRRLAEVRAACDDGLASGALDVHPSFFEVMTATALLAFRDASVEVAVLEVGLGGRLDATNAADPVVSVVVSIDLDHVAQLGGTLRAIAVEKAAIARPGRALVVGVPPGEARDAIRETCDAVGATLIDAALPGRLSIPPRSGLEGAHQIANARVALATLEAMERAGLVALDPGEVERGLRSVRWPGRLQRIPGTPPILLDGAHNPGGSRALAAYLRSSGDPAPVLVFATMRDKDAAGILDPLGGALAGIVLTRPRVERAADPGTLREIAASRVRTVVVEPDPGAALDRARELAGPEGLVLVAGSLYLVGEILAHLEGGDAPGPVAL